MKLKKGFLLRSVAGRNVVVPDGETLNLELMITLNDVASFLWKEVEKGAEKEALIEALTAEYDVDEATAAKDVEAFVEKLRKHQFLEEV